jgi:lipopolysaccharide/colanic/teichoic acid biosynthesis glycosyltransferase
MFFNSDVQQIGHAVRLDSAHGRIGQMMVRHASSWYGPLKVCLDCALALVLLVLSAPVVVLACLAVKFTSRGPMLYRQTRLGRGGQPYTILKIRTMTHDCERKSGACWARPNDPRIIPVGRFLRRMHIDELPQLWNVLRTDMSLVGPRPERPELVSGLLQAIPRYRERLCVRPGVTGLAQLQLPADTDIHSVRRKLTYDVYYVENMGFWLDFRLLLSTGVYLCGLPFYLSQRWLAIPCGRPVESAFCDPQFEPSPLPEFNAV